MSTAVIDTRKVPPLERYALIFSTFDGLPAGAAFELVNNHDPVPLYFQFRQARKGLFEWQYLTEGPAVWRVRIAKSPAADAPAFDAPAPQAG